MVSLATNQDQDLGQQRQYAHQSAIGIPGDCVSMISDYAYQRPAGRGHHRTIPARLEDDYRERRRLEARGRLNKEFSRLSINPQQEIVEDVAEDSGLRHEHARQVPAQVLPQHSQEQQLSPDPQHLPSSSSANPWNDMDINMP